MQIEPEVGSRGLIISADGTAEAAIVLVCQLDSQFQRQRDTVDGLSKCGPKQKPSKNYTGTISGSFQSQWDSTGALVWDAKASMLQADKLFKDNTVFNWVYGPLGTPQPGEPIYSGKGFFTSLTDNEPNDDMSTIDFEIALDGEYETDTAPATT